jgi:hypothetical protein
MNAGSHQVPKCFVHIVNRSVFGELKGLSVINGDAISSIYVYNRAVIYLEQGGKLQCRCNCNSKEARGTIHI